MPAQHGRDKEAESDDPMELVGTPAPGDPLFMARCLVEEYARMGKSKDELMALFQNSFYESAHRMLKQFGEDTIEELIDEVLKDHAGYEYEESVTRPQPSGGPGNQEGDDDE
jgi:hypothetical protein